MNKAEFSDRLASIWLRSRGQAGKTQEYVAKALGVSKKTIQNWEAGTAAPNFRMAVEWFDVLGVPMYPYIMELLYPGEIEGLTTDSDPDDLRRALHLYVDELDLLHVKELLYILHGTHGSSPTGTLDVLTAYLHLPLYNRVLITQNILNHYNVCTEMNQITDDKHVLPKHETIKRYADTAKSAVVKGNYSYTIMDGNTNE